MTGFDKLRLAATKTVAVAAVAAGLMMASASAAKTTLGWGGLAVAAAGVDWQVSNYNSIENSSIYNPHSGSSSSSYSNIFPTRTTAGFIVNGRYDGNREGFEGASALLVNGTRYQSPNGTVDVSSTANGVTVTGDEMPVYRGPLPVVKPLNVSRTPLFAIKESLFLSKKAPLLRTIYSIRNTTGSTQTAVVQTRSFSDDLNQVLATANGTTTYKPATDRYVVFGISSYYPSSTYYRFGTGAVTKPTSSYPYFVSDGAVVGDSYTIKIPAGKTVLLMTFARLAKNADNAAAAKAASDPKFNNLGTLLNAGYLADFDIKNVFNIVNWKF
jgi:hypothetical protein